MKIIHKNNFFVIICVSYTLISFVIIGSEFAASKVLNPTHWNLIMAIFFCTISVFILSLHRIFQRFSPLVMILLQYVIAIILVMLVLWIANMFSTLDKDAYFDAFKSFTIPYAIGTIYYYVKLRVEVKKQNETLQVLKKAYLKQKETF